jgi:hypothetical protein
MKSSILMVLTTFENRRGPLEAPYMSSMSHTSGTNIIDGNSTSESKEFSLGDNVSGVGGWNCTLGLINLLVILFSKFKSQHLSMMKPNFNPSFPKNFEPITLKSYNPNVTKIATPISV